MIGTLHELKPQSDQSWRRLVAEEGPSEPSMGNKRYREPFIHLSLIHSAIGFKFYNKTVLFVEKSQLQLR